MLNIDVSRHLLVIDRFILASSNMDRREYYEMNLFFKRQSTYAVDLTFTINRRIISSNRTILIVVFLITQTIQLNQQTD
jgi:hypothetical protein